MTRQLSDTRFAEYINATKALHENIGYAIDDMVDNATNGGHGEADWGNVGDAARLREALTEILEWLAPERIGAAANAE